METNLRIKRRMIFLKNKEDAMKYFDLLKKSNIKFRLRPYASGFVFYF